MRCAIAAHGALRAPLPYVDIEVTVTRRPLRDRLLAALKAGHTIPGASLLRGLPFLVVNRK